MVLGGTFFLRGEVCPGSADEIRMFCCPGVFSPGIVVLAGTFSLRSQVCPYSAAETRMFCCSGGFCPGIVAVSRTFSFAAGWIFAGKNNRLTLWGIKI